MDWIPAFAGMTEWMDIVCHSRLDRESSFFVAALGDLIQTGFFRNGFIRNSSANLVSGP